MNLVYKFNCYRSCRFGVKSSQKATKMARLHRRQTLPLKNRVLSSYIPDAHLKTNANISKAYFLLTTKLNKLLITAWKMGIKQ